MSDDEEWWLEEAMVQAARDQFQVDGDLEFDEPGKISWSDNHVEEGGTYVQAWKWVPFPDEVAKRLAEEEANGN